MPLSPDVEMLLQGMAAAGAPPIWESTVEEARAGGPMIAAMAGESIPVGSVENLTIPVDGDTSVGARVYTPSGDGPFPVVVFFHGGGWVVCDLDTHDNPCRQICRDAEAVVVSIDYRMGPEFRFPTAPNDCFAATQWVAANAASLNADASRLAVCGDSAGGNLSAVVSQMARDAGGPAITFAALIYPATDMADRSGSMIENGEGYFLELKGMEWFMGHYINEDQLADPLASPLLNNNLMNLPPCFITTCEFDPLRDQGEAYGEALRANGGTVEMKRYDGLIHGAVNMMGVLAGGAEMVTDVASRLKVALHG
jgi:acetyl esterase